MDTQWQAQAVYLTKMSVRRVVHDSKKKSDKKNDGKER